MKESTKKSVISHDHGHDGEPVTVRSKNAGSKKGRSLKVVSAPKTRKAAKAKKGGSGGGSDHSGALRLIERRKHPRFLLSREQFREIKTGRIFAVYDLSANGLSIKVEDHCWEPGNVIQGVLNLHPDSIEVYPRLIGYHGDRAALKFEALSTYSKSVLDRALSPRRLGSSLCLIREKLPIVDYWYHGVCNTDLLLRLNTRGDISKVELFFSNFYWNWAEHINKSATGVCQSVGREQREDLLLAEEPVMLEDIDINMDARVDREKTRWAKGIVEAAPLEPRLKDLLLKKFEAAIE